MTRSSYSQHSPLQEVRFSIRRSYLCDEHKSRARLILHVTLNKNPACLVLNGDRCDATGAICCLRVGARVGYLFFPYSAHDPHARPMRLSYFIATYSLLIQVNITLSVTQGFRLKRLDASRFQGLEAGRGAGEKTMEPGIDAGSTYGSSSILWVGPVSTLCQYGRGLHVPFHSKQSERQKTRAGNFKQQSEAQTYHG